VHHLRCAEDGVDRAGAHALETPDAFFLADEGNRRQGCWLEGGIQSDCRPIEQHRQRVDGGVAARRTAVDRFACRDGLGVRAAAGMPAARALRLRQAVLDARDE
jgi:hypothetical protein